MEADVTSEVVCDMQQCIKAIVNLDDIRKNKQRLILIKEALFKQLCKIFYSGTGISSFLPRKGKTSVIIFIGFPGSGTTTTCAKYARYYQRQGWNPALVCADTFKAGAFDELKHHAMKAKIPCYGSNTESDAVQISVQGVEKFKDDKNDLIILDIGSKQESALLQDLRHISEATKPDLLILVVDGSTGQLAFDHMQAFLSLPVGAAIISKMDGHLKGGGALCAVAATKCPVLSIGTGEHIHQFELFDVRSFVSSLLGMSGYGLSMEKAKVVPSGDLLEGMYTLRKMYQHCRNMLKMEPNHEMFSMLPGFSEELMSGGQVKLKHYTVIMDSMTDGELNSTDHKFMIESRIRRIARGSGHTVNSVEEMLEKFEKLAKIWNASRGIENHEGRLECPIRIADCTQVEQSSAHITRC